MAESTLPKPLILALRERFGLTHFIEGGTFRGETAAWASSHFDQVITVEMSQGIYTATRERLKNLANVSFVYGKTTALFGSLSDAVKNSAVFWLDAHWSGENTYGENDECPLLEEIHILLQAPQYPFLLIDDARLFLSPPPRPHRLESWPPIDQVIDTLKSHPEPCYIVICNDVIVAVPQQAQSLVAEHYQHLNTVQWYSSSPKGTENMAQNGVNRSARPTMRHLQDVLRKVISRK